MDLQISMIGSPEDPQWMSDSYQTDLREVGRALRAKGLEIREVGGRSAREGCASCVSGEWKVALNAGIGPILKVSVGSWLQARRGRTVRLKMGEIEADVRTAEELASVIKLAKGYMKVAESES